MTAVVLAGGVAASLHVFSYVGRQARRLALVVLGLVGTTSSSSVMLT